MLFYYSPVSVAIKLGITHKETKKKKNQISPVFFCFLLYSPFITQPVISTFSPYTKAYVYMLKAYKSRTTGSVTVADLTGLLNFFFV